EPARVVWWGPVAKYLNDPDALPASEIQACLDHHNGVLEKSWRALGLKSRYVLARLIEKHGLEVRRRPTHGPLGA
ncbi:MAG TPA: hypothetical protein VLJ38_19905, partial [Polyangiaceae bacterium]|nr:hypothetical protein [Polyangiaceae bacterium]